MTTAREVAGGIDPAAGASLGLRTATTADGAAIAAIYAPIVRDTVISFELEAPDADEMAARIDRTLETHPWIVATGASAHDEHGQEHKHERVLGYAYATRFRGRAAYDWTTEVSVYVGESARGRGVARTLYAALFGLLERQGFRTLVAGITLPNEASARLHRAMGFRWIGEVRAAGWKFGRWHDVALLDRPVTIASSGASGRDGGPVKRSQPASPAPLRPVADVLAAWAAADARD